MRCWKVSSLFCGGVVGTASFGWITALRLARDVKLSAWGRNAVLPSFFQSCTSAFVPQDTDLVVIEFQAALSLQNSKTKCANELLGLLQSVHNAATDATIIFAGWPVMEPGDLVRACEHSIQRAIYRMISVLRCTSNKIYTNNTLFCKILF